MSPIRVLSPVVESKVAQSAPLPLPAELTGLTIGFLDNTKTNFALLTRHMAALLREHHGVAHTVVCRKANAATPAPPEVLRELSSVQLVVTGSAD